MARKVFSDEAPILRLSIAEYQAIPAGRPLMVCDEPIGTRWREICWAGVRVRELRGVTQDGVLIETYRPVIRVPAISRLVPRRGIPA